MGKEMNRRNVLGSAAAGLAAAATTACTHTTTRAGEGTADGNSRTMTNQVFVGSDGTCFQLRTVGQGDLVVIHPSLARAAADFDDIARLIANEGFRVLSLDPRGAGATRDSGALESRTSPVTLDDLANDLMEIVQANGGRAHMIGHDFGNRVMRVLAVRAPQMVRSITLWGAGSGAPSPRAVAILRAVIDPRTPFNDFKRALSDGFFAPGNDPTVWFTGWYPAAGALQTKASVNTPASQYKSGGRAPMLIVQGGQDAIAPPDKSALLLDEIGPRATRIVIDRAGHCLVAEKPDEVARATVRFLRQH